MPPITAIHIAIIAVSIILGILLGWLVRGQRAGSEKAAINDGWQEQFEAQRTEHERLLEQNKSLMEQNSQYQASNKDAKMRASELSEALKEAFERRDELQRQLKDIRSNLEKAVTERDQLRSDVSERATTGSGLEAKLERREKRIESLKEELKSWQDRLPPLIERYRERDEEAKELDAELEAARARIVALESMVGSDDTRVEPIDAEAFGDGYDASNETINQPIDEPVVEAADDDEAEELLVADEIFEASDDVNDAEPAGDGYNDVASSLADGVAGDDLKRIKGVGPAIEKTLNELGIRRFDQIAAMSEYDINRVANRLKGFRSRIYREDWIGQARELQEQKAGGR